MNLLEPPGTDALKKLRSEEVLTLLEVLTLR